MVQDIAVKTEPGVTVSIEETEPGQATEATVDEAIKTTTDEEIEGRTDADRFAKKPISRQLGDRTFTVCPLSKAESRHFRGKCADLLKAIGKGAGENVFEKLGAILDTSGKSNIQAEDAIPLLCELVTVQYDMALDLIYEYGGHSEKSKDGDVAEPVFIAGPFEQARNYIELNATDEQCFGILAIMLRLVFNPFVRALSSVLASMPSGNPVQPSS